jgi:endogenous inhibitor of DNA gyrase (YacG/DUF329 family)
MYRVSTMTICPWCDQPFEAKKIGAHAKKFCSALCKNRYHTALRQWAQQAIALGQLSVADLKAVQASCTAHGEGNEQ